MTTQKDSLTVAHWALNFARPLQNADDWVAMVQRHMEAAAAEKADILLMPEHLAEHWMFFAPEGLQLSEETGWMADTAALIWPKLQEISQKTGVALVAGSTSWRHETTGQCRNRAWMFFPDRAPVFHDKLVMTPSEKDPVGGWVFETGDSVKVFEWRGFRLSLVICLDVEMPALSHHLAQQDIDLLLVPSMTGKPAGYYRVFNCARARAVEQMTAVAVVGNIAGPLKDGKKRDACHSGAAVYIPSEEVFGHTGVFSDLPVHGTAEGDGKVLYSRDIPLLAIRNVRHGKAEAWPGPWDAGHVKVVNKG
ncbi:MAG: carbon-nitrogen hydrolase [Micavibrio sp.]|nr:carbon-nitrogen hydrolase [Micavibrio sp.]